MGTSSASDIPTIHLLASIFKRLHHQARNLAKELCRDSSVQRVRKSKGDIVFDESRPLPPRGTWDGFKFPGRFEGFEQGCGRGCNCLVRAGGVSLGGWGTPQKLRLTVTESYGEQVTLLT